MLVETKKAQSEEQSCEVESTSLGPRGQTLTCEHQNLLAELQSLASKHKAFQSEHRVVLSDYKHLQTDHRALQSGQQELKGYLHKKQGDNLMMAADLIESLSKWSALEAGVQAIHGQLQNISEEGMGLTAQLADLQERNMAQLRGTVAALFRALDQQKAENVGRVTVPGVRNKELDQQKSDNVAADTRAAARKTHKLLG